MTQEILSDIVELFPLPLSGPATIPWRYLAAAEHLVEYLANGVVVGVAVIGIDVAIAPDGDTPEGSGALTQLLPPPVLASHLRLSRVTTPRQPYAAPPAARGVESALDRVALALQELAWWQARGLRSTTAIPPITPTEAGALIMWDGARFVSGPRGDAIGAAQSHALAAAASASAASASAAAADDSAAGADFSAGSASASAAAAGASAADAGGSADAALASAAAAGDSAAAAAGSASAASASAAAAEDSATDAAGSAGAASASAAAILDLTVDAKTLAPGSAATVTYDPGTGLMVFGLPKGDQGGANWPDITNKPMTFPPSAHDHGIADIADLATALGARLRVDAAQGLTAPQQQQGRDNLALGSLAVLTPTGTPDATTVLHGDGVWRPQRLLFGPFPATAGSAVDVTGLPAWATEIVINYHAISTTGSNIVGVRVGQQGGAFLDAGYLSNSSLSSGGGSSSGLLQLWGLAASDTRIGSMVLRKFANNWIATNTNYASGTANSVQVTVGLTPVLTAPLDKIRLITADAFDGSGSFTVEVRA